MIQLGAGIAGGCIALFAWIVRRQLIALFVVLSLPVVVASAEEILTNPVPGRAEGGAVFAVAVWPVLLLAYCIVGALLRNRKRAQ
jgi:hypothetical protein